MYIGDNLRFEIHNFMHVFGNETLKTVFKSEYIINAITVEKLQDYGPNDVV